MLYEVITARVTPAIVRQVQAYAQDRQGVLIFAATVRHAQEVSYNFV